MRPEHLGLYRQPGRAAPHPDGTWAAVAIARPDLEEDGYPSRLWRLHVADGRLTPLTHGTADSSPVISPDGAWLAFVRGGKGSKPQLALMPTTGGEPLVLTDHPIGVGGLPVFSPDSSRIAYVARVPEQGRYGTADDVGPEAEPPRLIAELAHRIDGLGHVLDRPRQVFVVDVPGVPDAVADPPAADPDAKERDRATVVAVPTTGVEPVQVTSGPRAHAAPVWLDDAELLVLEDLQDALGSRLQRVRAEAGAVAADIATPTGSPTAVALADEGALWLLMTDLGEDGMDFIGRSDALYGARLTDAGLTDVERLTDPVVEGIGGAVLEAVPGGALLTRAHRGTTQLVRYADGALTSLLHGDVEVLAAAPIGPDGAVLATAAGVGTVGDVVLVGPDGALRHLTDLSSRLRAEAGVHEPVELDVRADDGYPVHGWVALPEGEGPHPVLLMIHGGPHSAYSPTFFDEAQVYAGAGYAVVFCNPRGSASYGEDHGRAIVGAFGDRDAADVMAFLEGALAQHPALDGDRVGVLGGSYGGYMTAWLTTREHRWAAAIVERGFLDPVSFVGSSDIGWFFGGRYLGEDPAQVAAQSPMAHVDEVRTPTLVIHSEQDWRCPVEQGQRWFVELKRRGVDTELLLFPGEGHELSRSGTPKHRLARFEHILRWWDRHLPVRAS